jgi:hypothetical protein
MRVLVCVALLALFALSAQAQGGVTIGALPAVLSAAWPSAAPIYSSWIPIYTTWTDLTRQPSSVTVQIDTPAGGASGGILFITSQNPTAAGQTSVTLTLSGTSLLNSNSPAGYFAFALTQPTFDPTTGTTTATSIRAQVLAQPDWTLTGGGSIPVSVIKRAVKISTLSETTANGGFKDVVAAANVPSTLTLVPGVLSTAITIEFLMPLTSPISTVTVQIDTNTGVFCGTTDSGTGITCPNDFYSYVAWTPDSNAPPAGTATAGSAQWNNVPAGTRKLTFQIVANPRIGTFQPFQQALVYQNFNGRYPNLAWFPSANSSGSAAYALPNLRLTLSGGEANQYNVPTPNSYYLFNPVASINQVPIFLENVAVPQLLTGLSKTFTYHLAHVIPGQTVSYSLIAPPGITVSPATISFACTTLTGSGAAGCPTTATVTVAVDPSFDNAAYGTVQITAIQPSASVNVVFPRTIPSIQFNVVDRFTDNDILVDPIPQAVAFGQSFSFSVRLRVAPAAGVTLQARFISSEFSFDQSTYSLSAASTGFTVTATAIGNNLMKTLAYAAPASQVPGTPYTTGGQIASVFGFITAVWTGAGVRNYLSHGLFDIANENYGTIRYGSARTPFENSPAGAIEIYRPTFNYKTATILNSGAYVVTTWDQPSAKITVALKNAPTSGGVSLTPIINCAFVTATPATLAFPVGTNEASFTLTANRDGYYNTGFQTGACTVNFAMSGESSLFYTQPPAFTITLPTAAYAFTVTVEANPTNVNGNPRTFAMSVTPNFLPRSSVTVQPFWALGSFTPATQTWSNAETSFTKTFVITESDFIDIAAYTASGAQPKITGANAISFAMSGPDAGYYTIASAAAPVHAQRVINFPAAPAAFTVGNTAMVRVTLSDAPTAGTLVLTPVTNEVNALQFDPASYTFTAGQATTALFQVTGLNIGAWYTEWELTGSDAYLYTSAANAAQFTTFTVSPRGTISVNAAAPAGGFFAGFFYGPFSLSLGSATGNYANAAITATSLTVTPTADDWTFQPPVLTFTANGISTPFNMKYTPNAALMPALDTTTAYDFQTVIEWAVTGDDAWMYAFPAKSNFAVKHRTVLLQTETGASIATTALTAPAGVPVLMWVTIPEGPVPSGGITVTVSSDNLVFASSNGATGTPSLDVVFSGSTVRQQVLVWTNFNGAWGNARVAFPDTSNAKFSIYTTVSGPDAPYYAEAANFPGCFNLVKKLFYFDVNALTAGWQNLVAGATTVPQIPLGQTSQRISVGTTGLVSTDVTLTPVCGTGVSGCPYISFSPSELTFVAGQQVAYFTMTPIGIAPKGAPVIITWAVTGTDAAAWDIQLTGSVAPLQNVPGEGVLIQPVPRLTWSPTPAIYVDGKAENLVVTLADPTTDFPPFQLVVTASSSGVAIEPDIMSFTPGSAPTQTYSINHIRPSQVAPTSHSYTLSWAIKYAGATTAIPLLPRVVPVDACEVRVVRYAIIPEFPTVLGLEWLKASINLTRPPFGDVALIPHLPNFGAGNINVGANPNSNTLYYPGQNQVGIKAPGGRVIFDPPAVTFVAGQTIAPFKVRADRLSDNEALYLRVDWEPVFHAEDVNCYYPFAYTWHIAAASTATMAWALVAALAALLVL